MPFPEQGNPYTFSWKHAIGIGVATTVVYILAITGWRKNAVHPTNHTTR